jgi:hypothetical protein
MSRRGSRRGPRSFGDVSLGLCLLTLMAFLVLGPFAIVTLAVCMFLFPDNTQFYAEWCIRVAVTWVIVFAILILLEQLIDE